MLLHRYDVVIVGAGPAGASCALRLSGSGLKVAVLDKAKFPRDKICGDALSVDVVNQLPMLSADMPERFAECVDRIGSYGVKIISPENVAVEIPFVHNGENKSGYVCPRLAFDAILFNKIRDAGQTDVIEECKVHDVIHNAKSVQIMSDKGSFESPLVIGADGANSVVQKLSGKKTIDRNHHSAGLRVYYEGVTSFHEKNYIELYFFRETLPGYLWVFPMHGGRANVGLGMLSSVVAGRKINLKELLQHLLATHPELKERFAMARPLETAKGHGLPLGSRKRTISGNRFILAGDAAGLIDPFTGEGIGNAIRSGRVAADHIVRCFEVHDFSAAFNKEYDREIYRRMWNELRLSRSLQQLCKHPSLFNFVFRRAAKSEHIRRFLTQAMADVDVKKQVINPMFYYRLFTSRVNG